MKKNQTSLKRVSNKRTKGRRCSRAEKYLGTSFQRRVLYHEKLLDCENRPELTATAARWCGYLSNLKMANLANGGRPRSVGGMPADSSHHRFGPVEPGAEDFTPGSQFVGRAPALENSDPCVM